MLAYNFIFVVLVFQFSAVYTSDSCASRKTCHECIRDPSLCVWCAKNDFDETRCKPQNSYEPDWCPTHLQNPHNAKDPLEDENFTYDSDHVIQIRPQKYKMSLRPGKAEEFEFSFKGAPNFPVDIYFLLDVSKTMRRVKDMIAKQSENIYNTIKNMTDNVYLGLGAFVDKRAFPYTVDFDPEETYSFRHKLSLNSDFTKFKEMVSNTTFGINRDSQEGGLDALAQVMACTELVGWRNESRKIIILLTDGPYHAAGDGKSAGLFQPYDGKCYTKNNTYTKELEMDYPSVGMINKLAVERNIIVLLYTEAKVEYIYRALSSAISGSEIRKYTNPKRNSNIENSKPPDDDDAIVKVLKEIYEKISSKIIFKTKVRSGLRKHLSFSFQPNCTSETSGSECVVEIGKEKQFVGTVKLLEYSGHDNVLADVVIESIGEKLVLDIDVIQSCDCERSDKVEINSTYCHGEKRVCGECSCSEMRYGDKCVCVRSKTNTFNDNTACIKKDSGDVCSGHGSCVCGKCVCREGYSGEFCDCNLASCPRNRGQLCSGPSNGECMCGKCQCNAKWSGPACECPNYDCMENGKVCNNRGKCSCGRCDCDDIAPWDKRIPANDNCKMTPCPECHQLQCTKLTATALCYRRGLDDCPLLDSNIDTKIVQNFTEEYLNSTEWYLCSNINTDIGCYTSFVYRYDDDKYRLELVVQRDQNCAETYYMFGGMFLVCLIVVGICTLVAWKLLTEARDRREFLHFVNMSAATQGVVENPLYSPPTCKFDNPGFRKRSFK